MTGLEVGSLIIGIGTLAGLAAAEILHRAEIRRDARWDREHTPAPRYVAADGWPGPEQTAAWEQDDHLPADHAWTAYYPDGSLGPYPDGHPGPGHLPRRRRRRHLARLLREIEADQRLDAAKRGLM